MKRPLLCPLPHSWKDAISPVFFSEPKGEKNKEMKDSKKVTNTVASRASQTWGRACPPGPACHPEASPSD